MEATNNLSYLLNHITAVLAHQADQVLLERLGIGFSQYKIMTVLQDSPGIRQKQIADNLGQTEASISRQIKLLTEQGLLTSHVRADNRREHQTTLTPRGQRFTEEAVRIVEKFQAPVFGALSDKQLQQLSDTLNRMHDALCLHDASGDRPLQR